MAIIPFKLRFCALNNLRINLLCMCKEINVHIFISIRQHVNQNFRLFILRLKRLTKIFRKELFFKICDSNVDIFSVSDPPKQYPIIFLTSLLRSQKASQLRL